MENQKTQELAEVNEDDVFVEELEADPDYDECDEEEECGIGSLIGVIAGAFIVGGVIGLKSPKFLNDVKNRRRAKKLLRLQTEFPDKAFQWSETMHTFIEVVPETIAEKPEGKEPQTDEVTAE